MNEKLIKNIMIILGIVVFIIVYISQAEVSAYGSNLYEDENHRLVSEYYLANKDSAFPKIVIGFTIVSIITLLIFNILSITKKNYLFNVIYNFLAPNIWSLPWKYDHVCTGLFSYVFTLVSLFTYVMLLLILINIILGIIYSINKPINAKKSARTKED